MKNAVNSSSTPRDKARAAGPRAPRTVASIIRKPHERRPPSVASSTAMIATPQCKSDWRRLGGEARDLKSPSCIRTVASPVRLLLLKCTVCAPTLVAIGSSAQPPVATVLTLTTLEERGPLTSGLRWRRASGLDRGFAQAFCGEHPQKKAEAPFALWKRVWWTRTCCVPTLIPLRHSVSFALWKRVWWTRTCCVHTNPS